MMMTKFAYFSVICLLWMSLISFRDAEGQTNIPSPNYNPCDLYDKLTGDIISTKELEVDIKETDMLSVKNKQQVINVNIAGGDSITLTGNDAQDVATLNQYGIDLFYNRTSGFIQMSISEEIDRDGPSADNRDDLEEIVFELRCSYQTPGETTHGNIEKYIEVNLKVVDSNDIAPVFSQSVYYVSNEELIVTATDLSPDALTVRQATATVTVSVERNERPVISDRSGYIKTISEGASLNTVIFIITATDPNPFDSFNGQFEYEIVEADALEKFRIDRSTGVVTPRVSLKNIEPPRWDFTVRVSDLGIPSLFDEASVTVNIQRISGPFFDPSEILLNSDENMVVNETLIEVQAIDNTYHGPLIYELRGDGLGTRFFTLEQIGDLAAIRLNTPLLEDSNKTPLYTLRVIAYRQNDRNVYAELIIRVNINRNPSISTYRH